VRIAGAQDLQVVQQPNHERFVLYDLPEGRALEWACSVRISGAQAPKKDSKRHGRYFASVFRIPPGGVGTTIGLLWAKENGYWKILSFETEADNDYSNVPDLRSKTVSGEPRKTFQADPEFLHAARQFHRNWFTRRMYDAALRVISPDTMGCVQFYMRPGETPPATWEQTVERWRMGMQRTTDQTGPQRELADAIRYVEPTDSRIAVVPHPDQDAFTIFALSDELGLAAQCSNRKSAHPEPPASLREAPAKGNYFATSFEIETAGGAPASFFAFWRKNKDLWEIYSYHVETP
jgi:hypothetical protein